MNLRTLTISHAHELTGIPKSTLRRLFHQGAIAGNCIGNRIRLSEASVEAFVLKTVTPAVQHTGDRAFREVEDYFS